MLLFDGIRLNSYLNIVTSYEIGCIEICERCAKLIVVLY